MNNEPKNIILEKENTLSIDKQRSLIELTNSLVRALNEEEFLQIVNIYNGTINRLVSLGKEQGIKIWIK